MIERARQLTRDEADGADVDTAVALDGDPQDSARVVDVEELDTQVGADRLDELIDSSR